MLAADDLIVNVSVFGVELCAMLMRRKRGDGFSVSGKASIGVYTHREGTTEAEVREHSGQSAVTAAAECRAAPKPRPQDGGRQPFAGGYPLVDDGRPFNDDVCGFEHGAEEIRR